MGETVWIVLLVLVLAYVLFRLERAVDRIDDIHRMVGILVERLPDDRESH